MHITRFVKIFVLVQVDASYHQDAQVAAVRLHSRQFGIVKRSGPSGLPKSFPGDWQHKQNVKLHT